MSEVLRQRESMICFKERPLTYTCCYRLTLNPNGPSLQTNLSSSISPGFILSLQQECLLRRLLLSKLAPMTPQTICIYCQTISSRHVSNTIQSSHLVILAALSHKVSESNLFLAAQLRCAPINLMRNEGFQDVICIYPRIYSLI